MNIIGEGINKTISEQIKIRQKIYGSKNRSIEQLEYLNSRTAFVKLMSSVNITDDFDPTSSELKSIKDSIKGNILAREFILFNGTSQAEVDKVTPQRSGLVRNNSIINQYAYGLGGLEFGPRPMPGIIDVNIKTENRGSLKTSTIRVKAWNRVQFEILDLLYLRLGYTVLLEFGNAMYFKNDGTFIKNRPWSLETPFLNGKYTTQSILNKMQETRIESNGNYDAIFGKVVNFSWQFLEDGSYDIVIIVRSIGDVIESLKTNILVSDTDNQDNQETEAQETPTIESYKDKNQLGKLAYDSKNLLSTIPLAKGGCRSTNITSAVINNAGLVFDNNKKDLLQQDFQGSESQYYIRLGALLSFIQNFIVPKYLKNNQTEEPIINFDFGDDNLIYTVLNQISIDPRVCLITTSINSSTGNRYLYASEGEAYVKEISNIKVGQVMNIYVNFMYVLTTLDANLDSQNVSSLVDFLKSILLGISKALGSINSLEPFIDEDTNTIKIIDQSTIPGKYELMSALQRVTPDETVMLDIYGYYNNGAGFVRNFGIKSELTPNLATMLTIGAQSSGAVVGEDSTALSSLNKGLVDRIKNEVVDAVRETTPEKDKIEEIEIRFPNANKNFSESAFKLGSLNGSLPTWDVENIDSYTQVQSNFLAYTNAKQAIKSKKPSATIGFIPVSLNLTLEGISGLKIYNALRIDTSYLPSNYPNTMDFIITGLTHNIKSNVWTTDITTNMVPKDPIVGTGNTLTSRSQNRAQSNPLPSTPSTPFTGSTPNADRLRSVLTGLGYNEKGQEISSGGDITLQTANATISVLTTIKSLLPSLSITVTGGNDLYHQQLSYNSRHSRGTGIDFVISPATPSNVNEIENILLGYAAGNNPNFRFINEYASPTKAATAKHFHISWGPGTESQSTVIRAIKLAQQGKITTYDIA